MSTRLDIAEIKLSNCDLVALIDAADAPAVLEYRWLRVGIPRYQYAASSQVPGRRQTFLHRFLMQPAPGMVVDHINRNSLDNRRENLRVCTSTENLWNTRPHADSSTGIKNVYRELYRGRLLWRAQIRANKRVYRKWFGETDADRELAVRWAAQIRAEVHGAFATDGK